ncbi:MAG: AMP-binding protein [Deltaproteobacteria bacterium]|nr:AMP-binding protein [Deltaproteobacteria bacterium]
MEWRLINNSEGEVADLLALPAAVAEARIAGRYILTSKPIPETIIIQRVKKKGILAGAEVVVDREEAESEEIEIAVQPRGGRGGMRPAETISLQELMLKAKDKFTPVDNPPDETAALIYTSGTTGNPKGVMLTHGNFLAECEATSEIITTTEGDRFATLVPFFHIYGLAIGLVVSLFRGCGSVLFPQYSPRQFLKRMGKEKVSILIAIPTQYHHLLLAAKKRSFAQPSLKYCISGAAPLPVNVIQAFKEAFGVDITEGYGLTETTAAVAVNPREKTKPGSVGISVKGVQIKIGDDQGNALSPHKAGEVLVKGKVVMNGYYNLPEETQEVLRDGWLCTGDIGYQDEEGYLYITERKKDIIIKAGFNISPAEIEELLCSHPKVKEAAVVGQKEKEGREEAIKGFIVPVEGEEITPAEIIGYCRMKLAPYKVPDEIEFTEGLPKSATGKVVRRELRQGYKDMRVIERG